MSTNRFFLEKWLSLHLDDPFNPLPLQHLEWFEQLEENYEMDSYQHHHYAAERS